jgi:hypothetical protein
VVALASFLGLPECQASRRYEDIPMPGQMALLKNLVDLPRSFVRAFTLLWVSCAPTHLKAASGDTSSWR